MSEFLYRNRRATSVENERIRVIVTAEGGHIAAIIHKATGVNPLWTPPWPSIEPSTYDRVRNAEYGTSDEAIVLSGIMGHSICLDTYGIPSPEEFAAGMPVHGEAGVVPYTLHLGADSLKLRAVLPLAQLGFRREIHLPGHEACPSARVRRKPLQLRSAHCLDPARNTRSAISGARKDPVPHVCEPFESN